MAIIRISKTQIEEANKARETALNEDQDFRLHDEQRQRFERETETAREGEQQL